MSSSSECGLSTEPFTGQTQLSGAASAGSGVGAGVGAGVWGSLEEVASIIQVETETLPIRENQKAYQDAYSLYCELYGALKPVYDKGAALAL